MKPSKRKRGQNAEEILDYLQQQPGIFKGPMNLHRALGIPLASIYTARDQLIEKGKVEVGERRRICFPQEFLEEEESHEEEMELFDEEESEEEEPHEEQRSELLSTLEREKKHLLELREELERLDELELVRMESEELERKLQERRSELLGGE